MEKIDINTFCSLMFGSGENKAHEIEIIKDGIAYTIEMDIFVFDDYSDDISEKPAKCYLHKNGRKKIVPIECNAAVSYLEKNGFIKDGFLEMQTIDGFDSLDEFMRLGNFENIEMYRLLQKYEDCDEFSLTCYYGGNRNNKHHLDKELADIAFKKLYDELYATCLSQYELSSEEEKSILPGFDFLYDDIMAEVEELYKKKRKRPIFSCDLYSRGRMKYKQDIPVLWHIYNSGDFVQHVKKDLAERVASSDVRPDLWQLDEYDGLYDPLKPYVNRVEVTYTWHCTTSGALAKVIYFKLNEETKNWILKFKSEYDFEFLDDLAFYKGGKLRFSSCTHEGFHTDFSAEN